MLFLVDVTCMSLNSAALVGLFAGLDADRIPSCFSPWTPRWSVAVSLLGMALILSTLWLGQVVDYLVSGKLPDLIVRAEAPTNFVFVLDLGVVVPLSLLAAVLLIRDHAWGYALAGVMPVKAATMGIALVSMRVFAAKAGQTVAPGLAAFWFVLAIAGSTMSVWYFASCNGPSEPLTAGATADPTAA